MLGLVPGMNCFDCQIATGIRHRPDGAAGLSALSPRHDD